MTVGERIFKYRKQAGLSQEELAFKMNVSRQSVSLWETDQTMPSLESLRMLSEIFAVSLDVLCGTSSNGVETAAHHTSEKDESIACIQTKYTPELVRYINKISAKKFYIINIVALILSIIIGISIIVSDTDATAFVVIPIVFVIMFAVSLIRVRLSLKKQTAEFLELCHNGVVTVKFFQDYFGVESTSDNTDSKATVRYTEIKKVLDLEKCILIYYGSAVVPIEKNQFNINYDLILKLLNVSSNNSETPQNKKINALLLTMFVLSLLSIVMALAAVAISLSLSPLPDFPQAMSEFMWIFFIFIPLPLASVVLGIVFYAKKYKCKKNIIAGTIMCAMLSIYGSFAFAFNTVMHDFEYVHELEQTITIDLPDSGYISRVINKDSTTKSFAMIKFDNSNEIFDIVSNDWRFAENMNSIPSNFIDIYSTTITSYYNYFMLFDVTSNKANVIPDRQSEHRFIFLAYHIDKNILFVLDFVK